MSWEVSRNMRCETSFFSPTLYRKLLTRCWPIWAVWLVIWLAALPVSFYNQGSRYLGSSSGLETLLGMARDVDRMAPVTAVCACVAAIVTAVAVFFYLFNTRAAVFAGSLPLRREGLFATSFLAGLTMLLAPLVVTALLLLAVEGAMGCLIPGAVFGWLGSACLAAFFWFSFATLCCVISGSGVAAAVFYAIFNWVVLGTSALVEAICSFFLYGFAGLSTSAEDAVMWCTPVMAMDSWSVLAPWYEKCWIYAGVGFLMFLAALGLHHIRKAERAGDLIAFRPLRYVFKVCVIFCGGLALGFVFLWLFLGGVHGSGFLPFALSCAAAGVVCAFVAEMLLKKSFRVWKSWPWALGAVVFFFLFVGAFHLDLFGFTHRVPAPETVERVLVDVSSGGDLLLVSDDALFCEGDDVSAVADLHRELCRLEDAFDGGTPGSGNWRRVDLTYQLRGGKTLQRTYSRDFSSGGTLEPLLQAVLATAKPDFTLDGRAPDLIQVCWSYPEYSSEAALTPGTENYQAVWGALQADVEAGRCGALIADGTQSAQEGSAYISLDLSWRQPDQGTQYRRVKVLPRCTSLWAAVQALPQSGDPSVQTAPAG